MEDNVEQLKELCARFPDVEITGEDSHQAGNCDSGTIEFANDNFPSRSKITVKELARFIRFAPVRTVLWYKLRPLVETVLYIWYRDANQRRWRKSPNLGYKNEEDAMTDKLMLQLGGYDVRVLPADQEPE